MALPLPSTLSPSKVASFKDCALAFRFSAIDNLPEAPSAPATKGTLVHRALELLFSENAPGSRTVASALDCLGRAWEELATDPEMVGLELSPEEALEMRADAERLVRRLYQLEDPDRVRVVDTELMLEAELLPGAEGTPGTGRGGQPLRLRGIIDRLERDAEGRLVVTDYKTGRVPTQSREQARLGGVHFYAYLCEKALGQRPDRVQLYYLSEPLSISTSPCDQSIRGLALRAGALWAAIERACEYEDFRPRPSMLCDWCGYKQWCPAFGGDPALARVDLLGADQQRLPLAPVET